MSLSKMFTRLSTDPVLFPKQCNKLYTLVTTTIRCKQDNNNYVTGWEVKVSAVEKIRKVRHGGIIKQRYFIWIITGRNIRREWFQGTNITFGTGNCINGIERRNCRCNGT